MLNRLLKKLRRLSWQDELLNALSRRFPNVTFYNPAESRIPTTSNISIGSYSYFDAVKIFNWDERVKLTIGRYCSFGYDVLILAGGHHAMDYFSTYPFWAYADFPKPGDIRAKGDVLIGPDVWIGARACILSGVEIGVGAVVGAGSVVTRNVEPYAIVAGTPAKTIRRRFTDNECDTLLRSRWWERDIQSLASEPFWHDGYRLNNPGLKEMLERSPQ